MCNNVDSVIIIYVFFINTLQLQFQLQFIYYLIKDCALVWTGAHKHWYSMCNFTQNYSSYHLDD